MHHFDWKRHLQLWINLLKVHQVEVLEGDLNFHHLLVLLLEWEEVWKVTECRYEVIVTFNDREMKWGGFCLAEYYPH